MLFGDLANIVHRHGFKSSFVVYYFGLVTVNRFVLFVSELGMEEGSILIYLGLVW